MMIRHLSCVMDRTAMFQIRGCNFFLFRKIYNTYICQVIS